MASIELRGVHRRLVTRRRGPIERGLGGLIPQALFTPERRGEVDEAFAIEDLSLQVPDGKTLVVIGPSGCGKTTLLRLVAGLERPDRGDVLFDGEVVTREPPAARRIGMVFQGYALYPHLDARRNILSHFLFRERAPERDPAVEARLQATCELLGVEMAQLLDRRPLQLSGGEKQRVAIGRCITRDPRAFLLDEPFSALDAKLRERYRVQLRRLLSRFGVTALYVTHDQLEASILADEVAVMRAGRIEQQGPFAQVYREPASAFVADFLSLDAETPAINLLPGDRLGAAFAGHRIGVRCEDWDLSTEERPGALRAELELLRRSPLRPSAVYHLRAGEESLCAQGPALEGVQEGAPLWLRPRRVHVFDAQSGKRRETVEL